ncbi:hypothetical protein, variant 2 [Capsaspora owczarzaki ATCC 30864]|nr:hypothetical protein, variant 1 [Capsaspora owczarzaki ATCC 30864]KJE89417.1 hypothetical protein, variant 2 [Capsaspora owczarzaki ATCC 30864]
MGMSFTMSNLLSPYIEEIVEGIDVPNTSTSAAPGVASLRVRPRSTLPKGDLIIELVLGIFGFQPGQVLSPFGGQNEFLSALVATIVLQPLLGYTHLVHIVACIEATIPFRPNDKVTGRTPTESLHAHLVETNQSCGLGLSAGNIEQAVRRAVRLANRDVANFAYTNSATFLDNTWRLLPETNHGLRNASSYTVREFRVSVQKMEGFLTFLQPEVIFSRFQDEPSGDTFEENTGRARHNLEVSRLYLGCKLAALAIMETISYRLGMDVPLSMLTGDLPRVGYEHVPQLADFLPDPTVGQTQSAVSDADESPLHAKLGVNPLADLSELEQEVLCLLEFGRARDSSYDRRNSPLATFLVKRLGFAKTTAILARCKVFFSGKLEAEALLAELDPFVVESVQTAIVSILKAYQAILCHPLVRS